MPLSPDHNIYSIPRMFGVSINLKYVSELSAGILPKYDVYDYKVSIELVGAVYGKISFKLHDFEFLTLSDQLAFVKRQ